MFQTNPCILVAESENQWTTTVYLSQGVNLSERWVLMMYWLLPSKQIEADFE